MAIASISVLFLHYIFVSLSSDVKLCAIPLQKRGNFDPERASLIAFTLATIFRTQGTGNRLDVAIAVVGLSFCVYQCFSSRALFDYRLKYLNGLLYITGFWLLLSYSISGILLDLGKPISRPLLIFLLGLLFLTASSFFLRPVLKLNSLSLSSY